MPKLKYFIFLTLILGGLNAMAHFQVILPSDTTVEETGKAMNFLLLFTHPMEMGPVMEMGVPVQFGVVKGGKKADLLKDLKPVKLEGKSAYEFSYKFKEPGDYVFYIEPAPYWEAAEKKYIIHYTKVIVDVLGAGEGWDVPVGLPVEIEPLTRPYGLWTGNVFQGIVKKNGKAVPFATVEVEYYNEGKRVKAPSDMFTTQVIKADANGVFTYAMPRAGWWGFAALLDGDKKMKAPDGSDADIELGGLIWIKAVDMQ